MKKLMLKLVLSIPCLYRQNKNHKDKHYATVFTDVDSAKKQIFQKRILSVIKSFFAGILFRESEKKALSKGFNFVIEMAVCEIRQKFLPLKYRVCNSRVEICHTFNEISLNLTNFTAFVCIKMLTSLFSFTSGNGLSLPLHHCG